MLIVKFCIVSKYAHIVKSSWQKSTHFRQNFNVRAYEKAYCGSNHHRLKKFLFFVEAISSLRWCHEISLNGSKSILIYVPKSVTTNCCSALWLHALAIWNACQWNLNRIHLTKSAEYLVSNFTAKLLKKLFCRRVIFMFNMNGISKDQILASGLLWIMIRRVNFRLRSGYFFAIHVQCASWLA